MGFLGWLVGKKRSGIVKNVADGVDQFVHTKQDAANEQKEYDKEITKRWVADSDAPLTRLTRPFLVIFVTVITFVFGALDGNLGGFEIKAEWLTLYKQLLVVMITAYFGSRGLEKIKRKN
jgi:hypothetical protein